MNSKMLLKKYFGLVVLSTLSLAACSSQINTPQSKVVFSNESKDSIIAGEELNTGDVFSKSTVGILNVRSDGNTFICSGILLPGKLVLTAAHCLGSETYVLLSTQYGGSDATSSRKIDIAAVPQFWNDSKATLGLKDVSDIAILHFEGQVPEGYEPAELLTDINELKKAKSVLIAGFGTSSLEKRPVDKNTNPNLKEDIISGKVICDPDGNHCHEFLKDGEGALRKTTVSIANLNFSKTEVLLDQSQGTGACFGDSGGPAFVSVNGRLYVWGVISRFYADKKGPCASSVTTNILAYKDWIEVIKKRYADRP